MDFVAVVDQAIALLRQRGRLTYRTLQRQFQLDAAALDDLKDELIEGQRLAADESGRVLVWTGDTETPVSPISPSSLPASPPAASSPPEAERRQLTVLFCDLVDSTVLASQLDPEDLREVVRAYQETCAQVIARFEGYIAQYLGDGLLVYFGYPQAHEDDAQRAAHAGLGIVEAVTTTLNPHLEAEKGVQLTVRLGVHTGPVVVGQMGGGGRHEHLATGETVNIAARLEGLAASNTVVISRVTARLVREAFALADLGPQRLKGIAESLPVFRVLGPLKDPDDETAAVGVPFLVGRDEEVGLLLRRWEQSKAGLGQAVLLSGEAGIGKSSLEATVRQHVGQAGYTRRTFRCSPYHTTSALYPVIAHVQRVLHWQPGETPEGTLAALERVLSGYSRPLDEVVPLYAALLSVPVPEGRYAALPLSPQQQRHQTLDALVGWLLEDAERHPTLAMWEDLHWADPSTLELLGLVLEQTPTVPMLHVLTFRPEFVPPWPTRSHLTTITLNRLERPQVEALITRLTGGKALPVEVITHIVATTDGVPLYVEELTKMLLDSALLREDVDQYVLTGPLRTVAIPDTLQAALLARLDQLPAAKEVAQRGAVLGREFPYALLQAIAAQDDETLQTGLRQLVEAELLYHRGRPPRARYLFKHALIQEAAYASLLKSTRQRLHQQIVQVLEARFPEVVETQPELVAHHCTAAGQDEIAMHYWQRAGQRALQRSAYAEAIAHLTQGLVLLTTLPETPARLHQELDLQVALGTALSAIKGQAAPDAARAYARARELCQQVGDTPQLFPVLRGLMVYYLTRGQVQTAYQFGEQLLRLAHAQPDPALRMLAHHQLGMILCWRGELASAQTHHTQALALYTPQKHHALVVRYGLDLGVGSHNYLAWELWQLGSPDQALQSSQAARTLAQEVSHPYSLALALLWAAVVHQFSREAPAVHAHAAALTTLASAQGFALYFAYGTVLQGWALAIQGQGEQGMAAMRQGFAATLATGSILWQPYLLGLLAEAYGEGGHLDEGLTVLAEALAVMDSTEVRFYGAELFRLKGVLLLRQAVPDTSQAEACFHEARDVARRQQARSLELRATMSLARLWQQQGKRQEAYDLLAPIYGWFTEGFDTADLQEAKALLEELGG